MYLCLLDVEVARFRVHLVSTITTFGFVVVIAIVF
jgi:hypothetical protein